MSVHSFEIVASDSQESSPSTVPTPEPPEWAGALKNRMDNVCSNHTERLPEQASAMSEVVPENGTVHVRGNCRFDTVDDKTSILDSIESDVVIDAKWYEVRYHECDHDESNGNGCGDWVTERTKGTVPDDV